MRRVSNEFLSSPAGYEWIGWKNDTREGRPVELTFEFDEVRNFSAVHLYTNNFFTKDTQVRTRLNYRMLSSCWKSLTIKLIE